MQIDIAVIVAGAFLGALVTGGAGFAFAVVANSLWIYILPPSQMVLLASACATVLHAASIWRFRNEIDYRRLWPFLVGSLVGVPLGIAALRHADVTSFRCVFGLLIVAYSLVMLVHPKLFRVDLPERPGRIADGAVGWISGIIGGVAMLHGVIPTLWCVMRGWDKQQGRRIYQPFIFITGAYVMLLAGISVGGDLFQVAIFVLTCLPALAAGLVVGLRVFNWLPEPLFVRLVLVLIFLSGLVMLI